MPYSGVMAGLPFATPDEEPKKPRRKAATSMPFDPAQMAATRAAAEKKGSAGEPQAVSVSQLAESIHAALKAGIPGTIRVVGEVSGFRDRTHWYFDLKDASAVVNCVAFATAARKSGVQLRDGMQVVVTARIDFYAKSGKVSLIVERIEPVGAGALDAKLRALIAELRELGWMDAERKRPLPKYPMRIAVVTSRTAAALQDVLDTLRRRAPFIEVIVCDTRVQGEQATAEIARTIDEVSRQAKVLGIDAILVTRGGGSLEDLWCFNERMVAEAIVRSSVPVVAAIGHETDTTLAELVADERAATPTQAAVRLSPDRAELLRQVDVLGRRMMMAMDGQIRGQTRQMDTRVRDLGAALRHRVVVAQRGVVQLGARLERLSPSNRLARLSGRLESLSQRVPRAMRARLGLLDMQPRLAAAERGLLSAMQAALTEEKSELDTLAARLAAVSPMAVLERGYSMTTLADGSLVRHTGQAPVGSELHTRLADGIVRSRVEGDESSPLRRASALEPRPSRRKRRVESDDTPGLFGS
jgi:exodeoxyribonuclease VII large subunit